MYKINDYLVCGKDVCKVYAIEEKKFNNDDYYLLKPVKDLSLKISTPVNDKAKKIRPLITKKEVETIINNIPNILPIDVDEKLLEQNYKNLLKIGTHEDLIKIIKTTYLRNKTRLDNKNY